MSTETLVGPRDPSTNEAGGAVHGDGVGSARDPAGEEGGDTPRAVPTLFDLDAVRVEDAVENRRIVATGWLEHQGLIEADSGMPVGKLPPLLGGGKSAPAGVSNTMKSLPSPCIFVKSMRMVVRIPDLRGRSLSEQ